jgi:cell division cycle 14
MEFPDGSCPSDAIINRFCQVVNASHGAVAVHCRAGLGRTGTLIGAYIARSYKCTDAKAVIAWMRLCRPGMVVGD